MDQINIVTGETKVFQWNEQVNRNFLESYLNGYIAVKLKNPNWNLQGIVTSVDQGRTYSINEGDVYIAADNGSMLGFNGVVKGEWIVREGGVWVNKGIQTISTIEVVFNGLNIGTGAEVFADAIENVAKFRTLIAGQNITITENEETITIATTEASGEANVGQNVGDTGLGLYKQKSGVTLQFKKIAAGNGLSISEEGDVITISNISPEAGETNTGESLGGGVPIYSSKSGVVLQFNSLAFSGSVSGDLANNVVTISSNAEINTASNVGSGIGLYKEKVVSDLRFKSILGDEYISISSNENEIQLTFNGIGSLSTLFPGNGITGSSYDGSSDQTWDINFSGNGFANTVARSDHNHTLDSLSNAAMSSVLVGDVPSWNGENWVNVPMSVGEILTGVNLGTDQYTVFVEKSGTELRFRRLKPGSNIALSSTDTNYIEISATGLQTTIQNGLENQFYSWDKTWRQVSYNQLSNLPSLVTQFSDLSDVPVYVETDALKFVRVNATFDALEYATVDLSVYEPSISEGISPQYYSWDKTWKQIDYSEIANTPSPVNLSNYVDKTTVGQIITGQKIFEGVYTLAIKNAAENAGLIKFTSANTSTYEATFGFLNLTQNRQWQVPDKSGTLALDSDVLFTTTTIDTSTFIVPKTISSKLAIGSTSFPGIMGDESLLIKSSIGYGTYPVLRIFEKDYYSHTLRLNNDGNLNIGSAVSIGGVNSVSLRTNTHPKLRFYFPTFNYRYVGFTLNQEPAGNIEFYLPHTDGTSGQVLTTDGSGNLSWGTVSGGGSYSVFTNTAAGLVPAPNSGTPGSKFLRDDATWQTIDSGIVTYLRLNTGTYRSGELTLQTVTDNAVSIVENTAGIFTISHVDTSVISNITTSNFNIIGGLTFDDFGHVTGSSTRSLLPGTSNGYFLRDDGSWVAVSGGGGGTGTVTSVTAGNGMTFSPITTTGSVVLGTPSNITNNTTNSVSTGTHTHKLTLPSSSVFYTDINGNVLPTSLGNANTILSSTGSALSWITNTFLSLTDTPSSYESQAGKLVAVNGTNNGLVFIDLPGGTEHNPISLTNTDSISYLTLNSTDQIIQVTKISVGDIAATNIATNKFLRGDGTWQVIDTDTSYSFINSLSESTGNVSLVNDVATPGNNKYYGTNNLGEKGWHSISTEFSTWLNSDPFAMSFSDGILSIELQDSSNTVKQTITSNLDSRYYTESEIAQILNGTILVTGYNKVNWDSAYNWVNTNASQLVFNTRTITINGITYDLSANRTWNVGTVTSITAGDGLVLSGTLTDPIISIQALSGTGGSVGTIVLNSSGIGVALGTTNITAAAGNHTHTQLHDRSHAITSSSDHTANNWKMFYSNGLGVINELSLDTVNKILVSKGVGVAPEFVELSTLNTFNYSSVGLVPAPTSNEGESENRFLRADGQWAIPQGSGTGLTNPMTSTGDMIYRSSTVNPERLAIGTQGQVLSVDSGVPTWITLDSTFVMNITGDIVAGSNQVSTLQTSAINSKTSISTVNDTDEFLLNQTGLKKIAFSDLRLNTLGFTAKGQLLVGDGSNTVSLLSPNTTATSKVLTQSSSNTSWQNFSFINLIDTVSSIGTTNQLLRVNASSLIEFYTAQSLTAGVGLTGSSYNTHTARTWSLNFLTANEINGTSNNPARSDHQHTANTARLMGRSASLSAGVLQEISINTTSSESSMKFIGTVISAKLQNETLPILGAALNSNGYAITESGHIQPRMSGTTSISDLGSTSLFWRNVYSKGSLYLAGGTQYYAGNSVGDAYYKDISASIITARTSFKIGLWKFELGDSGNTLRVVHNEVIRFEFYSTGDMKFFAS